MSATVQDTPEGGRRRIEFARNSRLSDLLGELNDLLAATRAPVLQRHTAPRRPMVLVMGCPRSGSTLALQWLASLGVFSYPTNFLSRFYAAPYVGALVQRMLTDPALQFRDELMLPASVPQFRSDLGKTSGWLSPNEFWFFWRRFFEEPAEAWVPPGRCIDPAGLLAELAALEEGLGGRPLAAKGLSFNWQIPAVDSLLPRVVFLNVQREPLKNMQSLLNARQRFSGDIRRWYSFKPPALVGAEPQDPYDQVAAQVALTRAAVQQGLESVAWERQLTVDYETLCREPAEVYRQLAQRMSHQGWSMPSYEGEPQFKISDTPALSDDEQHRLRSAYRTYAGG